MRQPATEPSHVFLRACFGLPTDVTPVWLMRQAGRYLPEYRSVRGRVSFLELCKTPDLAAEVTIQPVDRLGVDAAILFSDILVPCEAMGQKLSFESGPPTLTPPVRTMADVEKLVVPDPVESTGFVMDAVRLIRRRLQGRVPLIGFAGAPLTLASYMVEGGTSRSFIALKTMMLESPATYRALLDKIVKTTTAYLNAQIEAGAQAVQLFDSWAGVLSVPDFRSFALPYAARVIDGLNRDDVPVIYFVGESAPLVEAMLETGADVLGVDWRLPLSEARRRIGGRAAVQGNLDPCSLFAPVPEIDRRVGAILDEAGDAPGHVMNLGHGVLPPTDPDRAKAMVEAVHKLSRARRQAA